MRASLLKLRLGRQSGRHVRPYFLRDMDGTQVGELRRHRTRRTRARDDEVGEQGEGKGDPTSAEGSLGEASQRARAAPAHRQLWPSALT